ncbi:MAG: hypothetical protein KDD94_09310 [Calditrichaeota bacterium]|nr:hypothetical protein [Calditrichota bacterium]
MIKKELTINAWLIIGHILMMLSAGIILILTFDFPGILRESMETTLNLFYKNRDFTVPAYYLFSLTGISFMTVAMLLYKTLEMKSTSAFLAVVFGVLFGLTSSLGFIRWPFLMIKLADLLNRNVIDKETLRLVYDSFHTYAGVSIGENFAFWFEFLWMYLFSSAIVHHQKYVPFYLARIGQGLGIGMLVYSLEQFGGIFAALEPLNMIVHTAQLAWFLALAFSLLNIGTPLEGRLNKTQSTCSIALFLILILVSFS